jgi:hypothetical protein
MPALEVLHRVKSILHVRKGLLSLFCSQKLFSSCPKLFWCQCVPRLTPGQLESSEGEAVRETLYSLAENADTRWRMNGCNGPPLAHFLDVSRLFSICFQGKWS